MKTLIMLLFVFAYASYAFADVTIFDVRKNLPMSDDEKVFRDFYINGGSETGLAVGQVVTVQRRMPLYDSYQNRSAGDLELRVAKVKIIHVQKGLAVARIHSDFPRENAPLLEDSFIMVGDRLDMNSATMEKGDGKKADANEGGAADVAAAPAPEATREPATPQLAKAAPQIVVNSVQLSTEAPPIAPAATPPPSVENSTLQ